MILMESVYRFFNYIVEWLEGLWDNIIEFFMSVIYTVRDMLKDIIFWLFETFLDLTIYILNGLSETLSFNFNPGQYIAGMPSEVTQVLGLCRIGDCMVIIVGAIIIKILLQLIPFTRLGS